MKEFELKKRIKELQPHQEIALGQHLYLVKLPSGNLKWKYRANGKKISLGDYNILTQAEARDKCYSIDKNIQLGKYAVDKSFSDVFEEWLRVRIIPIYTPKHVIDTRQRIKRFLKAYGTTPIINITSSHILEVIRATEREGYLTVAERIKQICGQVFRFAIASGYVQYDPTYALKDALQPHVTEHYARLTDPAEIGKLLVAIDTYKNKVVRDLIRMHIYTFVRPTEIRLATWNEIKGDTWVIPATRMKMRKPHIVPLSSQVKEILEGATNATEYIFPNRSTGKPYSDMAENKALRSLGFDIVSHGFRAMASTILHESGFRSDIIEIQLAHIDKNTVRATYNDAQYMAERAKMMQWWSDWLDAQKKDQPQND